MIHKELSELSLKVKNSINELLRETDIAEPSGIQVPSLCLIDIGSAVKIYNILKSLSDIDNVVGQPNLPCPVESQNVISSCRSISESQNKTVDELDFIP